MKLIPLPFETQVRLGKTHKLIVGFADLALLTSGTAQAVIPPNALGASSITLPAGTQVESGAVANVTAAFTSSGGAITSLVLSLGDGGTATKYVNAADLKTAGYVAGGTTPNLYTAADTIDIVATIVGQTLASLNAGEVELLLNIRPVNDAAAVR